MHNKKGSQIDIAVLDFSKDFGTVLHDGLHSNFSLNVSTLRVVSLSLSIIWHLHYGMISPWQLERQSVEIHLKIDWTSIGEGTL